MFNKTIATALAMLLLTASIGYAANMQVTSSLKKSPIADV